MTYVKIEAQSVPKLERIVHTDPNNEMYETLITDGYIELDMGDWMDYLNDFKSTHNPDQDFLSDWLIKKWNSN